MTPHEEQTKQILEALDPFDWRDTWSGWNSLKKWKELVNRTMEIFNELKEDSITHDRHHKLVCKVAGIFHLGNSFNFGEK